MAHVTFDRLNLGATYSRHFLAELWGYKGFQAISRGVVTPAGQQSIVLFVTRDKQSSARQYRDYLVGNRLYWEGPTDHFAESRIMASQQNGEQIHLFYRDRHHSDFNYVGQVVLECAKLLSDKPSEFVFYCVEDSARYGR